MRPAVGPSEGPGLVAALKEANERLLEERRIFVTGPVVVFKWRNAPGWPVDYVSPNVLEVFGWSAEEFTSGAVLYGALVDPSDIERVAAEVKAATESNEARFEHQPYRILHRDGRTIWLYDFTTLVHDAQGAVTHYLGYVVDVTDHKQVEEERKSLQARVLQSQKLESLGILAGGIAHDFNNLLTVILGNLGLLREELPSSQPSTLALGAMLADMESAARRAADLCRQMLDYSGKGRLVIDAYDLNEIITELAHLLEVSLPGEVEISYELCRSLPAVEVDATQIRQVIMNLITNAAEAIGPHHGRVVLETGLSTHPRGRPMVYARIQDDGRGMDEETMRRIFEPFFTTKFAGRGLGLAAVQGIVRGHGGTIEVQSKLNEGTTIEVRLPASTKPATALPQSHELDTSWRGSGVALVVDDEERVRTYCRRTLEHAGFEVATAADGIEALRVLREQARRVRVVFLDLTMPRMGGVEAHAEMRRLYPDLPVILATGFDSQDAAERFRGERPAGFLQKPFTPQQLLAAARAVLEPESSDKLAGAWT